ncbi:MAG TPA: rhodanese-related sulfurtransferase [Chitinophagaceae bacterium]|nr:rhodanese-related sulfurtransferase [Chitinophagaceae bacterium]HNF71672.1 rhodanese-related sulfurtransferase [Chitinophagaceae bacterium]
MAILHNRISHAELKEKMLSESEPRTTISFYRYFRIDDPLQFRDNLYIKLNELKVFGRIYVAHEGINAQLSIPESLFEALKNYLDQIPGLENIRLNIAVDDDGKSFYVLKIKVREKIVADGLPDGLINLEQRGKYLDAASYNTLSSDPETIIVDMRNHYEYEVGHFERAIEIPSDTFREQLPMAAEMLEEHKEKNIIMYCTGGIRCEKASAYMLHRGFQNVYHVEGGIIHYTRNAKAQGLDVKFKGKNFVFDERRGERISDEVIAKCHQCGKPCDTHTNCENTACHLLFIQCDECREKMKGCCSPECRTVVSLPEEEQIKIRKGIDRGQMIFNKSKQGRLRPRLYEILQNESCPKP